ncbi:MAG: tetratricopeptide repeat protein [Desulfomonile tiedjei]|nr:tetratricopeptide repeat protein [Desulfomonile tiedjei]
MSRKLIDWLGITIILAVVPLYSSTHSLAADDFEMGLTAAKAGQLDQAVSLWTRFIERSPKSYSAYVNRGSAYMRSGYVFRAVMDWHEARKLSPLFAFGVYGRDYIAQASGDTAMLNYASPLELDPEHIASVAMMGIAYLELGQKAKAVELYRKSVDLTKNPLLKTHLEHWADAIESSAKE